ncbi:MAG: ABC transporter permease, partial [Planctomycetota bacterium]|nr:ABC transporter permease [Planctomycetota bacterium]
LPGVSNAGFVTSLPMVWRGGIQLVGFNNVPPKRGGGPSASLRFVTPGYFAAMSIPVHAGRDISEADTRDAESVAVVSESFVRTHWPEGSPLGRHFQFAFSDRVVAGVVGDIRVRGLERQSEPQVYLPHKQGPVGSLIGYTPKDLVVKASTPPETLIPAIRSIIRQTDPQQAISDVRPLADIVGMETASRSVQVRVLGIFAAVAFLLAAVGIHGLLSFAVSQRTPEFGVRIALGAQRGDIVSMVLRQGALLAAAGVIPGIALAYAAGRALEALLAGVKPADAITFLAATGLCIAMTLGGSLLPALRALRIDPVRAIRAE